jgi:hypothetical protein
MSFQPRDVVDMQLAAQAVVFHELVADSARDVLRGMDDAAKARSLSALIGMGRLTEGHLDRLKKRGNQPYQTVIVAPPVEAPIETPEPASPEIAPAAPEREPPYQRPVRPESWLDEPYQEWVLETPAILAARAEVVPPAAMENRGGAPRKPVVPRHAPVERPAETHMEAATAAE